MGTMGELHQVLKFIFRKQLRPVIDRVLSAVGDPGGARPDRAERAVRESGAHPIAPIPHVGVIQSSLRMRTKTLSTFGIFRGCLPVLVAFCSLAATVLGAQWVAKRRRRRDRNRHGGRGPPRCRAAVGRALQAFDPLHRIALWWLLQGRPLTPDDWHDDAQLFLTSKLGLQRLIWLGSGGTAVWSAKPGSAPDTTPPRPDARSESDLRGSPGPGRHRHLAGVRLSEGRPVVYVCSPVYRNGRFAGVHRGAV